MTLPPNERQLLTLFSGPYHGSTALEQALTTYGTEKLSLTDAQELLSQIEPDENGLINYVEFVNMMTQS